MKGLIVVLCLALICTFTVGSSLRLRNLPVSPSFIDTNQTLEEVLNTNFSGFANALKTKLPAIWNEIVNATVGQPQGDFTIFAPTNAGLNSSAVVTQTEVLEYHIVRGDRSSVYFKDFATLPTLYNATGLNNHSQVIQFSQYTNGTIMVNNQQRIEEADIVCTNGIIQAISGVLSFPTSTVYNIAGASFSNLTTLLNRVNITLAATDITLLAPTDAAFAKLFAGAPLLRNFLFGTTLPSTYRFITDLLTAHVLETSFYPSTLDNGTNLFTSLAHTTVNVTKNGANGTISIRNPTGAIEANIVQPNLLAENGVVHGIDSVLAFGLGLNLREVLDSLNATTFLDALNTTGLGYLLLEDSPYTYFVPTNAALKGASVNASQLLYHISSYQSVSFPSAGSYVPTLLNLTTLGGQPQRLYAATYRSGNGSSNVTSAEINRVRVSGPYTTLKNTNVYLIEEVLAVPSTVVNTLAASNFSDFVGLLSEKQINTTGLFDINTPVTTIFAPTTDAFNRLPLGIVGYLRLTTGDSPQVAQAILNNHIIPNNITYRFADGHTLFRTAQNNTLDVFNSAKNDPVINGTVTINPVGGLTQNGIVYPVDNLILPPGLAFNSLDILRGLPADGSNHEYGNYSIFIRHLNETGLTYLLTSTSDKYTIFPPTNDAWNSAEESFEGVGNSTEQLDRLRSILSYHIVYGQEVAQLNNSNVFRPGNLTNTTLEVVSTSDKTEVQLRFANSTSVDSATVLVNTTSSYGQRIYGVDRVLGLGVKAGSSNGLTTLEWILIGVGGAVLGLIILLIVAGAAYYLLVRPGKDGYRQIN